MGRFRNILQQNLKRFFNSLHSFLYKNVVFPGKAEYSYFSAHSRAENILPIFLNYSLWHFCFRIYCGINYKCLVSGSGSRYIVHVLHRLSFQRGQDATSNDTLKKAFRTEIPDFIFFNYVKDN